MHRRRRRFADGNHGTGGNILYFSGRTRKELHMARIDETCVGIGCLGMPALPWPDAASCRHSCARRHSTHSGMFRAALSCTTCCPRRIGTRSLLKSSPQHARENAPSRDVCSHRPLLPLRMGSLFVNPPLYAPEPVVPPVLNSCAPAMTSARTADVT